MSKWRDQGFWKSFIYYRISVLNYWLQSARFWNYTWYEAANPAIEHGGMLNEKKSAIYPLLHPDYLPKTVYFPYGTDAQTFLHTNAFQYPIIIKPNVGLKGIEVIKVYQEKDALSALQKSDGQGLIVQEYIALPKEYSILYYTFSNGQHGISSLIEKKYPFITGDGLQDVHSLIDQFKHPYLNKTEAKTMHENRVLAKNEKLTLHNIGNYSRGSTFHSLMHEIDENLIASVHLCLNFSEGISFGRLDVKTIDLQSLKKGQFKIIEFNGGKSEPLHIYDENIGYLQALRIVLHHWKIYNRIAMERLLAGYKTISTKDGVIALKNIKKVTKRKK